MLFVFVDTMLNDCKSNKSLCGDGDEAHCLVNGTDTFCSCKSGFQSVRHNMCEGTAHTTHKGYILCACPRENINRDLFLFQIRMSANSLECVLISATTPRALTSAVATSTSPGLTTHAKPTVCSVFTF